MNKREKPNILWISFEDTNPVYGCYGDTVARTPNIDRLASEGCTYTHCFSTAGVCAPARSAVITGMYPISIGTHHMRTTHTNPMAPELPTPYSAVIPHYVRCFTEYLRAEGYYCTNNLKTDYQFDSPFTAWDECSKEAHWRNRPDPGQPFFAVFNPLKTHESGMWPENCPEITFDPDKMKVPPYFPDTLKVRESLARMYTNIEFNDRIFGEILGQLEVDGLAGNTVVFHWSDHGPLPRGKRWPYDSGIHVPLLIRWPGRIKPGSISDRLVSTIDLGPTVLSIAGIPIPHHIQGQAFLGGQAAPPRDYVYASRDRYDISYDMVRAVRDRRFKYIHHYRPELPYNLWVPYRNRHPIMQEMWKGFISGELKGPQLLMFQNRPLEELYDTESDPYEINNLVNDSGHKKELHLLRKALNEWIKEVGDMGKLSESEMVRQWYPGGKQPQTAPPVFIPISEENPGIDGIRKEGRYKFKAPVLIQLYCATQGASVGYTTEEGENPVWSLYKEPIPLEKGETTLRAKAIRIGYEESQDSKATFTVE
jgi:N-sulfoglucosamine sulfohydrolase